MLDHPLKKSIIKRKNVYQLIILQLTESVKVLGSHSKEIYSNPETDLFRSSKKFPVIKSFKNIDIS